MTRRSMFALLGLAQARLKCSELPEGLQKLEGYKDPEPVPPLPATHASAYCGGDSDELGAVAIGRDRDPYFSDVAWIPTMRLMRCRRCGGLWARKAKEPAPPR